MSAGYYLLAERLQEASMIHSDVGSRLRKAISDAHKGTDTYAYYLDHTGDGESGDVIYSSGRDIKKAPYSITKDSATMDAGKAVNVQPRTTYEKQTESKEALTTQNSTENEAPLKLTESFDWTPNLEANLMKLMESGGVRMPIKLIAPGKGSSAFYPAEVLKRDGPKVFKSGTHIYINHATNAEESARPEGDWHKLAGALEGNAYYDEAGKAGPGLYGTALFTSDYAPLIKEKAPFTGMSIRASGIAEASRKQDGVPVLKEFTHAESIDVVTRAGAGGMILTESARDTGDKEMTAEEIKALVVSEAAKMNAPLRLRALKGDAMVEAGRIFKTLGLRESAKQMAIENVIERGVPQTDTGELDTKKFEDALMAEAKRVAAGLGEELAEVRGMGASAGVIPGELTEAEIDLQMKRDAFKERRAKIENADAVNVFERLGMPKNAAEIAAA